MNKGEIRKIIKKLMYIKNRTKSEEKNLKDLILKYIEIDNDKNTFGHVMLGKYYLMNQDYKNAKDEFQKTIIIDKNNASSYYNLYKIELLNNNINSSTKQLNMYEENQKYNCNLTVQYHLLDILNNNIPRNIIKDNLVNCIHIYNPNLLKLWYEVIDYINNKEYSKAIKNLEKCNTISDDNNILVNFNEIIIMLNRIIKLDNKIKYEMQNNYDFNTQINNIYKQIKDGNIKDIDEKINRLKYHRDYSLNKKKVKFLIKIYNEEKLTQKNSNIKEYLNYGKLSRFYDDNYTAYQYFSAGLYLTNAPIFYYYMGVCLYSMDQYEEALKCFEKSIKSGAKKVGKSYYFKAKCIEILYSKTKAKEYYKKLKFYKSFEKNGKSFETKIENENIFNYEISNYEGQIKNNEINKIIERFELVDNKDKLLIIKLLYTYKFKSEADNLYNKYIKIIEKDKTCRKEVNEFNKNKKLLLAKSKY